jgi:hypothetical protein
MQVTDNGWLAFRFSNHRSRREHCRGQHDEADYLIWFFGYIHGKYSSDLQNFDCRHLYAEGGKRVPMAEGPSENAGPDHIADFSFQPVLSLRTSTITRYFPQRVVSSTWMH